MRMEKGSESVESMFSQRTSQKNLIQSSRFPSFPSLEFVSLSGFLPLYFWKQGKRRREKDKERERKRKKEEKRERKK